MASKEQIKYFTELFEKSKPEGMFKKVPSGEQGIGFVMNYLGTHDGKAYTNELAKELGTSTARISCLINKLEKRGLLKRETSPLDARKTIIVLSEKGRKFDEKRKEDFEEFASYIIDKVGMDELISFTNTAKKIRLLMKQKYNESHVHVLVEEDK